MLRGKWIWLPRGIYRPLDRFVTSGAELLREEANSTGIRSVAAPYAGSGETVDVPGQLSFTLPPGFGLLSRAQLEAAGAMSEGLIAAIAPRDAPAPGILHTIRIQDGGWLAPGDDERDFFLLPAVWRRRLIRDAIKNGFTVRRPPERLMIGGQRAIWQENEYVIPPPPEPAVYIVIRAISVLATRRLWDISLHVPRQSYEQLNEPFWTVVGSLQWA